MLSNFPFPVNGTFHKIVRRLKSFAHRFVGKFTKPDLYRPFFFFFSSRAGKYSLFR